MEEASNNKDDVRPARDLSETTLGEFKLLRRIGAGGMAEVYLAEQTSLARPVAVKVLLEDAFTGKNNILLKRFEQEARAAGGLSHPNIVQVYMTGKQGNIHYIVQEYVQGQNLSQLIKRNGPPQFLEGLQWMRQVAEALKAANDAGIVHRDVKPENIMITRAGVAKVTDFGLAQLNQQSEHHMNLTQAGTTMGTPWYMSPEQIQGEKLDHRSDQYSFGVTLYHLFAGHPPFPGRNSVAVAVQHLKEEPRPLTDIRRDLPGKLCDTIHRMMSKSPEKRFQTCDELIQAFDALEDATLNSEIVGSEGWLRQAAAWIPASRAFRVAVLACVVLGFFIGNSLYAPVRLPDAAPETLLADEGSPSRQFAVALLNPANELAWKSVYAHYPGTVEAGMARFQLAMKYLSQSSPDLAKATTELNTLYSSASTDPDNNRNLLALIRLAQAYIATEQGDDSKVEQILYIELDSLDNSVIESVLNSAPRLLRDSQPAERLRERLQDSTFN
jgi:serine/threonine-protein kinase